MRKTILIKAAPMQDLKINLYSVKTTGKNPVRLLTSGYLTYYDGELHQDECQGWFNLNQKDTAIVKAQMVDYNAEVQE